jgi:CBS domain-containing protein
MVPRQDMVCLFIDDPFEENMRVVKETGHTRYPLCLEDKDHVIGMVHIRDLMDLDMCGPGNKDLRTVMREILVVPEGMSVARLLQAMRRKRIHLAVVADEYGGTAGLVALQDVLEEIVGDIQDEHDADGEAEIQRLEDGSYEFDGRVLLDEVSELLNIRLEETRGRYARRLYFRPARPAPRGGRRGKHRRLQFFRSPGQRVPGGESEGRAAYGGRRRAPRGERRQERPALAREATLRKTPEGMWAYCFGN